jgi:hypothetical protein
MHTPCTRCLELDVARRRWAYLSTGFPVEASHTCHPTHAGVLIVGPVGKRTALFYLPNQTRGAFLGERIDSAHQQLQALQGVEARVQAFRAAQKAPHGLAVGTVLEEWRRGVAYPRYHVVAAVPHPRRARIVPCPTRTIRSGYEGTTHAPNPTALDLEHAAKGQDVLFTIDNGTPRARIGHGWSVQPWNGKPHHHSNDG